MRGTHANLYTFFFFFFFFLTLNRSTFNKVSMYPGLFWFWNIVLIVLWTIWASLTSDYDQSFFFVEVRRAYRKSQRKKVRLMLVRYAQLWERGTRFFTRFSEFYTARFLALRDGLRRKRGTARSQYDKKQKLITSEVELEVSNACLHKFSLAPWYWRDLCQRKRESNFSPA